MGEPVLSSWLDPVAPVAGSRGTTDKDLVQRHGEKADEVDARIRTLSKQLRLANAARNERVRTLLTNNQSDKKLN